MSQNHGVITYGRSAAMVEELLVVLPHEAGWNLLQKMDDAELEIIAAFWDYNEEDEEWQFLLATPLVGTKGPSFVLQTIQKLLAEMTLAEKGDLSLRDILVFNPLDHKIQTMRRRHGRITETRGERPRRFPRGRSEPYIYRFI